LIPFFLARARHICLKTDKRFKDYPKSPAREKAAWYAGRSDFLSLARSQN
jgi:hypothetical protein